LAVCAALLSPPALAGADATPTVYTGALADGATYLMEVPASWNHTLLLYSHGYYFGPENPAQDAGDPVTHDWLLSHGYALAGSSYADTGWAVQAALVDQVAVLDAFDSLTGQHPDRTIAWGHSLGGLVTAALVQKYPQRFTAAMPLCGWVSGAPAVYNEQLDSAFAFKVLLAPGSSLQLTNITDPFTNLDTSETVLANAQADPAGRARIALVSALAQLPGWVDPTAPEPAPRDFTSREYNQFLWYSNFALLVSNLLRAEFESRAGGNPSWNTGVDYRVELNRSGYLDEVKALYAAAGIDLEADLATLASAPRIAADPAAVAYAVKFTAIDGQLSDVPVLTMHATGDGIVPVTNEQAYESAVDRAGSADNLRQLFVHRAGHCTFTPAETITGFQRLFARIASGHWPALNAEGLNADASALGPAYNQLVPFQFAPFDPAPSIGPAFVAHQSAPFLRPFPADRSQS
jgi:pimeloyl-ACP methyl ester carboxylesterase